MGSHQVRVRGVSCRRARRWEATRSHSSSVHSTHAQNQGSTAARRPGSRTWSQQVTEITERERREPGLGVGRTEAQRQAGGRCQSRGGAPWPHDARGGQLRLKGPRGGRSRPWPLYPLQQDEGQLSSLAQETCQGPPPGKARICPADTARPWGAVPPLGPAPPSGTCSAPSWELPPRPALPRLGLAARRSSPSHVCLERHTPRPVAGAPQTLHFKHATPWAWHTTPPAPRAPPPAPRASPSSLNVSPPRRPCARARLSVSSVTPHAPVYPTGDPRAFSLYVPKPYAQ